MSTILKALRRLEEDRPPASLKDSTGAGRGSSPDSSASRLPATDPGAADQLRTRILAEEAAARAGAAADPDRLFNPFATSLAALARNKLAIATSLVLFLAIGLIGYSLSGGEGVVPPPREPRPLIVSRSAPAPGAVVDSSEARTNAARTSPPAPPTASVAGAVAVADTASAPAPTRPGAPPASRPPRVAAPMPLAAVAPTRSSTAADPLPKRAGTESIESNEHVALHRSTAESRRANATPPRPAAVAAPRPRPSASETAPAVVSARVAEPVSEAGRTRVALGSSSAPPDSSSRRSTPTPNTQQKVERIDHRGLPDISVVRTSWHPRADNRSARIRLEASNEILNLHEGDAVGGLVVKEISPSSVLFEAGDVEIRRRVGQSSGE